MRILLLAICILIGNINYSATATQESDQGNVFLHGTVVEMLQDSIDEENFERHQIVSVRLDDINVSGKTITVDNKVMLTSIHQIIVKTGDRVIIWVNYDDLGFEYCRIYSFGRDRYLLFLGLLFVGIVLLFGGKKGLSSITSLVITLALVFMVFLPMIINGVNPVLSAVAVCMISTVITLFIIGKSDIKTYSAIAGTLGGILVAGLLTYLFGMLTHIQGIQNDSAELLSYFPKGCDFNFKELLFAGIIIGSLGAIMDVSMSIASSMEEIRLSSPRITSLELFKSGIRIGKDIMGTMTNTLILAYVGSSINVLLVFYIYGLSFIQFINSDQIASEILRSLSGSIGLILSIPMTSLCYILIRDNKK